MGQRPARRADHGEPGGQRARGAPRQRPVGDGDDRPRRHWRADRARGPGRGDGNKGGTSCASRRSVLHDEGGDGRDRPGDRDLLVAGAAVRRTAHVRIGTWQGDARHRGTAGTSAVAREAGERRMKPSRPLPILIVDDEPQLLNSVSAALRSTGFPHVIPLEDPKKVGPLLREQPVGALLLDLSMPGVSGRALLAQVTGDYPEVPVIVLTATNDLDTAVA